MPRTGARGGPQTRAKIAEAALRLFIEHGFDNITVAQVAREAGVSSVTVFNHFPRKEDLFLDRSADALDTLRTAVRDRRTGIDVLTSLRAAVFELFDSRHPLSGIDERSLPFFRTVAASPALIARAREIAYELQQALAEQLNDDPAFPGDAPLFAAFFLAGYSTVLVETAARLMAGEQYDNVVSNHRQRLDRLFDALHTGFTAP